MWYILAGFFFVSLAALSIRSAWVALRAAQSARAALESLAERISGVESATKSNGNSIAEALELLAALANKVKMQRVRNVVAHGDQKEPDPHSDPQKWRDWTNAKIAKARMGIS